MAFLLLGGVFVDKAVGYQVDCRQTCQDDINNPCRARRDGAPQQIEQPGCGDAVGIDQSIDQPCQQAALRRQLQLLEELHQRAVERDKDKDKVDYKGDEEIDPRADIEWPRIIGHSFVTAAHHQWGAEQQQIAKMYEAVTYPHRWRYALDASLLGSSEKNEEAHVEYYQEYCIQRYPKNLFFHIYCVYLVTILGRLSFAVPPSGW